jgi:hypothetical protein
MNWEGREAAVVPCYNAVIFEGEISGPYAICVRWPGEEDAGNLFMH